jgi:HK97 family phage major capsid protein
MSVKLKQKQDELSTVRTKMKKVFDQAGEALDFSKVTEISGTDEEKSAALRQMAKDAEKIVGEIKSIEEFVQLSKKNDADLEAELKGNRPPVAKTDKAEVKGSLTLGQAYLKARAYQGDLRGKDVSLEGFQLKTLMDRGTTSGVVPESLRSGRLEEYAVRPVQVLDLIPSIPTDQAAYKYMEETTRDEANIVEKAEAAAYGELALGQTERSATIEKLPAWIPVTDEQLADVAGIGAYIDARLTEAIKRRLDYQALNGLGNTPLMLGILNKAGILAQAAEAGDGKADTILRAVTAVRVTGRAIASSIVMHPTDWLNERLRKTQDGAYIWGNPDQVGIQSMWGLPVAQADSITLGTALVGDFRMHSAFVSRQEMQVKSGYINDDLIKGRNAVVAYLRGAFVWFRPAAFSTVALPD